MWTVEENLSPEYVNAVNGFMSTLNEMEIPFHGFMVIKDNKLLTEKTFGTYTPDSMHRMFSVAKSFAALGIGCLADEGKLSLDDKICDYFPEYIPEEGVHEYLAALTIRQMLSMTTCYGGPTYRYDDDWTKSFFVAPPSHIPGSIFNYDTSASFVLGALVEKLSGKKVLDYLREKCLNEIGFSKEAYIQPAANGVSDCGSGLMCSMRDLAKIITLCANYGKYNGKQLLPEWFIREAGKKQICNDLQDNSEERHGYGYFMWKTRHDGYCMYGLGGQLAVCFPNENLVFVTIADTKENVAGIQILWRAFYDYIYPCFNSERRAATCFAPTVGELTSPSDDRISKKKYVFGENPCGFISFSLDTEDNIFEYEDTNGTHQIPFGRNQWQEHTFPGTEIKSISSGNWIGEENFAIKTYLLEYDLSHTFVEFAFRGEDVVLRLRASGEPFLWQFKGKIAIAKMQ